MTKQISLEGARVLAGLNQQEAAAKFGVHYQTLASWEKDPRSMKQEYVLKIPEIYYVPVSAIFFGSRNEFIRYYQEENNETTS